MVGPNKQDFWPKINTLKGNHFYFGNTDGQKGPKWYILSISKIHRFKKNFLFKNTYQFRRPLFSSVNFWTTLFSKIVHKKWFPMRVFTFGQKSSFLASTIFEISQPNWHCEYRGAWPKVSRQSAGNSVKWRWWATDFTAFELLF
jgi:hypothetical protein